MNYLQGEWITETPLDIVKSQISDFDLPEEGEPIIKDQWVTNALMCMMMDGEVHNYCSNFDFKIAGNDSITFKITWSAAGIKVGSVFNFIYTYNKTKDQISLTFGKNTSVFDRVKQKKD